MAVAQLTELVITAVFWTVNSSVHIKTKTNTIFKTSTRYQLSCNNTSQLSL